MTTPDREGLSREELDALEREHAAIVAFHADCDEWCRSGDQVATSKVILRLIAQARASLDRPPQGWRPIAEHNKTPFVVHGRIHAESGVTRPARSLKVPMTTPTPPALTKAEIQSIRQRDTSSSSALMPAVPISVAERNALCDAAERALTLEADVRALRAARDEAQAGWERECADGDRVLIALGFSVETGRTEGGSIHLGRVLAKCADLEHLETQLDIAKQRAGCDGHGPTCVLVTTRDLLTENARLRAALGEARTRATCETCKHWTVLAEHADGPCVGQCRRMFAGDRTVETFADFGCTLHEPIGDPHAQ